MNEQQKFYEIGFVSSAEEGKTQIEKTIKDLQGEIVKEGENLRLKLMYPINKQTVGFFSYIQFTLDPENVSVFKKTLKLNSSVLRFLFIKPIKGKETIQPEKEMKRERIIPTPVELLDSKPIVHKGLDISSGISKDISKQSFAIDNLSNEELEKKIEEILQ